MSVAAGSRGIRIFYGNRQRLLYRVTVCIIGYIGKLIAGSAIRHARLIARVRVAAVGIQHQRAVHAVGTARQLYRRNVAFAIHAPAVSSGLIVFQNIAAHALSLFSKPVHVILSSRCIIGHHNIHGAGHRAAARIRGGNDYAADIQAVAAVIVMRRIIQRRAHRYRSVGGYARNFQRHHGAAFRPGAYQLAFGLTPREALASGNHNVFRRAEHC